MKEELVHRSAHNGKCLQVTFARRKKCKVLICVSKSAWSFNVNVTLRWLRFPHIYYKKQKKCLNPYLKIVSLLSLQILDASSLDPTLQSSAMILLCTVLLLIFIFISSIFIWKWVYARKLLSLLQVTATWNDYCMRGRRRVKNGYREHCEEKILKKQKNATQNWNWQGGERGRELYALYINYILKDIRVTFKALACSSVKTKKIRQAQWTIFLVPDAVSSATK